MKTETKHRVMWVNDDREGEMNQDNFDTVKSAEEYCSELKEQFIEEEYYVEPYEKRIPLIYNENAVDGWEDLHPDYNEDIF